MNLTESFLGQMITEQHSNSSFQPDDSNQFTTNRLTSLLPEDCLVGWSPQVQHSVVEPGVLVHPGEVALLRVLGDPPARVLDLERELGVAGADHPHLGHVELHVLLSATLNLVTNLLHHRLHVHYALLAETEMS